MGKTRAKGKLAKLTTKVNKIIKAQETKTHDRTFAVTQLAFDTDNATALALIPQGDSRIQRDGSKLLCTFLDLRMMVRQETTPVDFGNQFRVVILKAKQRFVPETDVATTTGGLWQNGGTLSAPLSPFERNNRTHYTVLYDRSYYINGGNAGSCGRMIHIKKKLNHTIDYEAATSGAEAGQLWCCMTVNRSAASADACEVSYTSRLYFKDS